MHNPFILINRKILEQHIRMGHKYYVRQTYPRGIDPSDTEQKAAFLITQYMDISLAKIHYAALSSDRNRFLYDISIAEHYKKLETAAGQPTGYRIYAPLLAQREWKPSEQIRGKVKRYIDTKLKWKPKGKDTVKSELFLQFGELFITLKLGQEITKVPLAEIEKF